MSKTARHWINLSVPEVVKQIPYKAQILENTQVSVVIKADV